MKKPVKIRKPAEDEIDEFLDDSILDLDNCTVDEDFDEIDINSLIDKNILKDLKDAGQKQNNRASQKAA